MKKGKNGWVDGIGILTKLRKNVYSNFEIRSKMLNAVFIELPRGREQQGAKHFIQSAPLDMSTNFCLELR